jgi:hypothetical protein
MADFPRRLQLFITLLKIRVLQIYSLSGCDLQLRAMHGSLAPATKANNPTNGQSDPDNVVKNYTKV